MIEKTTANRKERKRWKTNVTITGTAPAPTTAHGMENAVPCVAHHRDHDEGVPGCFFSKKAEATYDRSIRALAIDHGIIK